MQFGNTIGWSAPTPVGERPDFGTTEVPDHPGHLMPSPGALWRAFESALAELERHRDQEPRLSGYAARSQNAVYEAGLFALAGSLRAIYQEGQRGNPNALAFPEELFPKYKSYASGPGSGKSPRAKAFMVAVAREGMKENTRWAARWSCSTFRPPMMPTRN